MRVGYKPEVDLLEERALLSASPTFIALQTSAALPLSGEPLALTATVSDLSPGGATPNGGLVTFSDEHGTVARAPLFNGVASFKTTSITPGTYSFTASYGGDAEFAPSTTGTIVTAASLPQSSIVTSGGVADRFTAEPGTKATHPGVVVVPAAPAKVAPAPDALGVAVDSAGDVFIADQPNDVVRELVKATGVMITVAGNGTAGYTGDKGPAIDAELNGPLEVAVDPSGDLFIADSGNHVIREVVKATGDIITVAGNGTAGYSGDGGPAKVAELDDITAIAVDSAGHLYIADGLNDVIRLVDLCTGQINTIAGNGSQGSFGDGGPAKDAELEVPSGLAVDSTGNLYIADRGNNMIFEILASTGDIVAIAGNGFAGYRGDNGPATNAELNAPIGVAVDAAGNLFIADGNNNVIREVEKATGKITTVAGNGTAGYRGDNGPATNAELNSITSVAVDSMGDLFIGDAGNNVIRQTAPAAVVVVSSQLVPPRVVAESLLGRQETSLKKPISTSNTLGGFQLQFNEALDPASAEDAANYSLTQTIGNAGNTTNVPVSFTVAYNPSTHTVDLTVLGAPSFLNGGLLTLAPWGITNQQGSSLVGPTAFQILPRARGITIGTPPPPKMPLAANALGVAVDSAGDVFIADHAHNVVRELVKATGALITVAGNGTAGYSGDNGPATDAELNGPIAVAVDSAGNLFIADSGNNVVREVVKSTGKIITVAGNGTAGLAGDFGPATDAEIADITSVAVDSAGNLFIADGLDDGIREVLKSTGKIVTIVGDAPQGSIGYGGPARAAELEVPSGVCVDPAGDVFIADRGNNMILEVVASTGDIVVVAGNGIAGYRGNNSPATHAELNAPIGVAVDASGNLFIADAGNNVIREVVKATGDIVTVPDNITTVYSRDPGPGSDAAFSGLTSVAVDSSGQILIGDATNNVFRQTAPAAEAAAHNKRSHHK